MIYFISIDLFNLLSCILLYASLQNKKSKLSLACTFIISEIMTPFTTIWRFF